MQADHIRHQTSLPMPKLMALLGELVGGFVAATALVMRMPLFILLVGIIYLAESVSVILQVGYFKLTKGKRLFRMAPLHHHIEMCGWSETKIVAVFSVITALACLVALSGIAI